MASVAEGFHYLRLPAALLSASQDLLVLLPLFGPDPPPTAVKVTSLTLRPRTEIIPPTVQLHLLTELFFTL